jgi:hypothetical protein
MNLLNARGSFADGDALYAAAAHVSHGKDARQIRFE